jgi:hypothetical protein
VGRRRVLGSGRSDDDRLIAEVITAVREPRAPYPVAISLVALIGSFNVLHSAVRFASRGLVRPASQKYTHGPVTPTCSATSATDSPRFMRASRRCRAKFGLRANDRNSILMNSQVVRT